MYARVVDGQIETRAGALPQAWRFADGRTTGNFDLLDEETHIAEGWFLIVDEEPSYDPETEQLGDEILTVNEDTVTRTWEVVAKSPPPDPPGPTLAEQFASYKETMSARLADRDELLGELADWLLDIDMRTM